MKLRKVKKRKHIFHKLLQFITNYNILNESTNFNWSFLNFWWNVQVKDVYDVIRLQDSDKVDPRFIGLLFLKKIKSENYIEILHYITRTSQKQESIILLHELRLTLMSYRALNYFYIEMTFPETNKTKLNLFIQEIGFRESKEKSLINKLSHKQSGMITLTKFLNEV